MGTKIVMRKVAAVASDFSGLPAAACIDSNPRSNPVSIAFRTDQANRHPVVALRRVVPEKSRAVVQIEDDHVDVAIVVVVAERSTATRPLQEEPAAHFGGDVAKAFAAQVSKQLLRLQVRRAQILTVDVGIHVAVGDEQIEEAVVVHFTKTPPHPTEG